MTTKRAAILSGAGRTADPWHPYLETSEMIADIARGSGFDVEIMSNPIDGLAGLDASIDLIIVNAGDPDGPMPDEQPNPGPPLPETLAAADRAFSSALRRGTGILALHSAAATLRELPAYREAIGGQWIRGVSSHPPIASTTVHLVGDHPIRGSRSDFSIVDERYMDLVVDESVQLIAEHEEASVRYPLIWARDHGFARSVYSGLGHDTNAYLSEEYRRLLTRAMHWLTPF